VFNVLLVCVMKEISCSYRGNKKHYRAFGGKYLSTMENAIQNFCLISIRTIYCLK